MLNNIYTKFTIEKWQVFLEWICLICTVVLILVWPLPGTIAARNTALVLGCISSLIWIYITKPIFPMQTLLAVCCLLIVPVWLFLHYFAFQVDATSQLYDLQGTWMRATLGIVMASGLGFMIANRPNLIYLIWFIMTLLAFISVLNFIWNFWLTEQLVVLNYRFPFKYKSALVYFLTYPCLFSYAVLHMASAGNFSSFLKTKYYFLIGFAILSILICWIAFINAQALNGILIASLMGIALLIMMLKQVLNIGNKSKTKEMILIIIIITILIASLGIFSKIDQKNGMKLINLLEDVKVSIELNKDLTQRLNNSLQLSHVPTTPDGRPLNMSTYQRISWIIMGLETLQKNPLGAGFSHLAFQHFMRIENSDTIVTKTHSGWLDYAIGLGVPGLFFTWLSIYLVIWHAFKLSRDDEIKSLPILTIAIWSMSGIWILWFICELSEREFIEHLFFFIAFFSTAISKSKKYNNPWRSTKL